MPKRGNFFKWLALGLLLPLWLIGCAKDPIQTRQAYVFGTLVQVSIYGESEARATQVADHVFASLESLNHQFHAWKGDGELIALNRAFAQGKSLRVSPRMLEVLQNSQVLSQASSGKFNPAIGHLIALWGFERDEFTPISVDPKAIQDWVSLKPSMQDIVIQGDRVSSKNRAVKLDMGGYLKGYALDLVRDQLHQEGVHNALINLGGNIMALGQYGKRPWRVGIQHPRKPEALASIDLKDGWSIGTSGDYQRYFELAGKRYCHIIDPATGYPVSDTQSVTVLIPPSAHAGVLSDVASKPLFMADADHLEAVAQAIGVNYYLRVDARGHLTVSPLMKPLLIGTNHAPS
jgi:FAD:protein FMN transferase